MTIDLHSERAALIAFCSTMDGIGRLQALVHQGGLPALERFMASVRPPPLSSEAKLWLQDPRHAAVSFFDPDYPSALKSLSDPPLVLWVMGQQALLRDPALAIVGSRNASAEGLADAEAFAQTLGAQGLTIVSGLARGIDAAAHKGALNTVGKTIAVLGHGPDRIYPPENRRLAHAIRETGLLLSEFPPGTPVDRAHFPHRNRLISGLSLGVLVVEATVGSGSLITARLASEQGREVMVLPGSIHSPHKKGCHRLIREGATLVETAQDVLSQCLSALRPLNTDQLPPP